MQKQSKIISSNFIPKNSQILKKCLF